MTQPLANYSVDDLISTGFATFKDGAREAGRYFCEAERREPGSVKRHCQKKSGDFRDAQRAMNWYSAWADTPDPIRPQLEKKKEPTSPYEKVLKAALKLSRADKQRIAETLVSVLEAA